MKLTFMTVGGIIAPLLAATAGAETLCGNGDPLFGYGVTVLSELDSRNHVGDTFTLDEAATVQQIEWWGQQGGTEFLVRIFPTRDGIPAATPFAHWDVSATGVPEEFSGVMYSRYVANLPGLRLDAGDYVLSIVGNDQAGSWFWATACEHGCEKQSWRRTAEDMPWSVGNFAFAFLVYGATAPPSGPTLESSGVEISVAPNPFRAATNIAFELPRPGFITLDLHDVRGSLIRRLASGEAGAGSHAIGWDGTDTTGRRVAAGAYLYRLGFEDEETTGRIVILH